MSESKADTINSVANAIEKVGNSKWLSAAAAGFLGILLYTMFENRAVLFSLLISNTWVAGGLLALGVILALSFIYNGLQQKVFVRYETELQRYKESHSDVTLDNTKLRQELIDCRVECKHDAQEAVRRMEELVREMRNATK